MLQRLASTRSPRGTDQAATAWLSTYGRPRTSGRLVTAFPPNPTSLPATRPRFRRRLVANRVCTTYRFSASPIFAYSVRGSVTLSTSTNWSRQKPKAFDTEVVTKRALVAAQQGLETTKPCAGFPYAGPGLGGNFPYFAVALSSNRLEWAAVTVQMRYLLRPIQRQQRLVPNWHVPAPQQGAHPTHKRAFTPLLPGPVYIRPSDSFTGR